MEDAICQDYENITFNPVSDQMSLASGVVFGTTSAAGIVVSTGTLAYIAFKLKLNPYMKIILGITVGANLISSILNAIALLLFAITGYFTLFACRLNAYSTIPLLTTINMLNSISVLRNYMSHLASKTRILKQWQAVVYLITVVVSCYGFGMCTIAWQEYSVVRSAVTACMREDHFPASPTMPILMLTKIIVFGIVGLTCDLSLYSFMKKRVHDANAGAQMIPWKSGNKEEEENDLYIPVRASILSSVFMAALSALTFLSLVMVTGSNEGELLVWLNQSLILAVSCGSPVLTIAFTIKAQEDKKKGTTNAQPPGQLQFHDDENRPQSELENEIELQDLGLANQIISKNVIDVDLC